MKTKVSPQFTSQMVKLFWITIVWTILSMYQFLMGYSAVREFDCNLRGLDPSFFFYGSIFTGILAGLIGGSGLVFLWEKWLRSKNYRNALFSMFWSYCLVYLAVAIPSDLYTQSQELNFSLFNVNIWKEAIYGQFEFDSLNSFAFWLVIVLLTLIVLQVNDKYGPGVFLSFLMGKYFQPRREERIFMFLDLRSSTSIAEKLGEERYFSFIREVFKDVTPAILDTKGEIYQYVGDEIIVSWKMNNGLANANCIQCFFEIQKALIQQKKHYTTKYDDIQPVFKAGLHYGHVMAGEIGVVKRDIAFSGDVLNTTARIQSKCNELGVEVLLSKSLLDKIGIISNQFQPRKIGDIELRGKQEKVMLYSL